jgi:signal recognition particle subunit SRP54
MALEGLTENFNRACAKLTGKGVLSENDIDEAMREIRLALLEADVNFKVAKEFIGRVKEKALGEEVHSSLNPSQQVIKIVHDELKNLLGDSSAGLTFSSSGGGRTTVYLLAGLQGSGKTTTAAKLALYLRKKGKRPLLAACDVYRPAAIDQLEKIATEINVPVYANRDSKNPVKIAKEALRKAEIDGASVLIVDTAGRLQIDEELMDELSEMKKALRPQEVLLVVDALTGQDAVNSASGFNEKIGIDGIIMTKFDGDSRGGAALSIKSVTGKPIKLIGVGEKPSDLEEFHPERIASRILGMGDVLTLIEKAEAEFDDEEAQRLEEKMRKNAFTLNDFLAQTGKIKKMGGISKVASMIPGANKVSEEDLEKGAKEFAVMEAIMLSMTEAEREDPKVLNASRRKRIAAGSGNQVSQVNNLVGRSEQAKKMMKQMSGKGGMKKMSEMLKYQ